tara:strand:- start:253 stop:513 length:261 start_codon:yes stop_codon:yes gene_type:complete
MLYISGMNNIEYAMQVFGGTYQDDRGWQHYRVEDKTYDIRFHPMTLEWECSCPAYKFKRGNKTCKHIKEIQENRQHHQGRGGARVG